MAAAKDKLFLKIFSRVSKRGVPAWGLVITSALITLLMFFTISPDLVKQFKVIILIATLANLIPYLYTPVSEIILLRAKKGRFETKATVIAIIALLYSFWAIIGAGTQILSFGAILLLASIPIYLLVVKPGRAG